jgi:hypothetical protein
MKSRVFGLVLLIALVTSAEVFAQSGTLYVVEENGPRGERINIVFLSEGYTSMDMAGFRTHVQNAANYLFSRNPWRRYRPYCNIYRIEIASNESGTDYGSAGQLRDTYFNSGFNNSSVPQLLTIPSTGRTRAFSLLNQHVPEYDMPIMLVNDTKYGGSGGAISVASVHSSSAMIVEHEIGHSFAGLADEYDTDYAAYTPKESYNATQVTSRTEIRWKSWIEPSTPVVTPYSLSYENAVGAFLGANYRATDWYRPHYNSLMRNLGRPVGQVNAEKFVLSIYGKVSPIDGRTPSPQLLNVSSPQTLTFSLTPKQPAANQGPRLSVQWLVNGIARSGATTNEFSFRSDELGNGSHTVTATVIDTTTFVRDDPMRLLTESVTWSLSISNHLPITLAEWRAAYGPDEANPANDGFNNLLKYALGLDPLQPIASSNVFAASLTATNGHQYLTLTVLRNAWREDVQYLVHSSGTLSSWGSGSGYTVLVEDTLSRLRIRDALPVSQNPSRYLRFTVGLSDQ